MTELSEHDQETVDRTMAAIFFKALKGREPTEEDFDEMFKEMKE